MDPKAKRNLLIVVAVFFAVCIGVVVVAIYENNKNPYDKYMDIANLDDYTTGKPSDRRTLYYIKYMLFNVISDHTEREWENGEIKDILVRDGTFSQTYVEGSAVHAVSFVVDIESISQSYLVRYQWTSKRDAVLPDAANAVVCVEESEMIYDDFGCSDMFAEQDKPIDPILDHLPHSTVSYTITGGGFEKGKYVLNVKIQLSAAEMRSGEGAAAAVYQSQARAWVKSVGFNPDDYVLKYEIIGSSLY